MKAKKAKSNKKTAAKANKRVAKKDLEASITDKFMEVITNLGHDAGKIGKDIKRASKVLAKKLADKLQDVKNSVEDTFETNKNARAKTIKRPVSAARITPSKSVSKAEKVVAKVTKASTEVKPKRAYNRRTIAPADNQISASAAGRNPVTASKVSATKPAKQTVAGTPRVKRAAVSRGAKATAVNPVEKNGTEKQEEKNNTI